MTALVLIFCLQAQPSSCIEQQPIEDMTAIACLIQGQQYAANWLSEHPKWVLARWRCEHNIPRQRPV